MRTMRMKMLMRPRCWKHRSYYSVDFLDWPDLAKSLIWPFSSAATRKRKWNLRLFAFARPPLFYPIVDAKIGAKCWFSQSRWFVPTGYPPWERTVYFCPIVRRFDFRPPRLNGWNCRNYEPANLLKTRTRSFLRMAHVELRQLELQFNYSRMESWENGKKMVNSWLDEGSVRAAWRCFPWLFRPGFSAPAISDVILFIWIILPGNFWMRV